MWLLLLPVAGFAQTISLDTFTIPGPIDLTDPRTVVQIPTGDPRFHRDAFVLETPVDDYELDELLADATAVDPDADAHLVNWDPETDEFVLDGTDFDAQKAIRIRCAKLWKLGWWCRVDVEGEPPVLIRM